MRHLGRQKEQSRGLHCNTSAVLVGPSKDKLDCDQDDYVVAGPKFRMSKKRQIKLEYNKTGNKTISVAVHISFK